ncbi:hypothetical protein K432DRAFT_154558 [Lepidopterella palustris CBS 459.81]|uniref:Uncharacterized protein n=1 Tax=Lepidopterella palustris CBS 459.81 TaxID=1314670 RepID=A0A8E2JJ39_9PEZI|nr:hypothetical protein K432DRAFT_154558 [Lepidopterella palustris CBS 459.81]
MFSPAEAGFSSTMDRVDPRLSYQTGWLNSLPRNSVSSCMSCASWSYSAFVANNTLVCDRVEMGPAALCGSTSVFDRPKVVRVFVFAAAQVSLSINVAVLISLYVFGWAIDNAWCASAYAPPALLSMRYACACKALS